MYGNEYGFELNFLLIMQRCSIFVKFLPLDIQEQRISAKVFVVHPIVFYGYERLKPKALVIYGLRSK